MKTANVQEGAIATELFILGPRDVRVLTVNRAFNYVLIQFRELDKTSSPQNTYATTLSQLRPKAS